VITGDGCTAKRLDIYIQNPYQPKEKYLVGQAVPVLGQWKWETVVGRQTKTYDGEVVTLKEAEYSFIVHIGDTEYGAGSIKWN